MEQTPSRGLVTARICSILFISCPLAALMLQKQLLFAFKDEKSSVEWAVAPI
jgi:hypothetical protein